MMTKIYTTCIIGFVSWCAVAQAREINIWSNEGLWHLHYMIERAERKKHFEENMTPPTYSINKALLEFNYGSDGSTKSEELLQLPSNED